MSVEENIELLRKIEASNFRGITELNLSCPNVPGKPQVAYDFPLTEQILEQVFSFFTKPLGVKLPPYFDLAHFDQMAEILNKFPLTYINSINSIGNGLYIDPETEAVVIKPKRRLWRYRWRVCQTNSTRQCSGFRDPTKTRNQCNRNWRHSFWTRCI